MVDFANFDPSQSGSGGGYSSDKPMLPPGTYVMAAKMFKRRQKNGRESLMFVCVALLAPNGKIIGKDDYSAVFETCTLTAEAAWRLGALCSAVGRTTPFNAGSDQDVAGIFIRKPFKAKVIHDTYGGKVSAKIKEYAEMTEAERKKADLVLEDWQIDGDSGDSYSGGDEYQTGTLPEDVPPPTDDDLPL